MRVAKKTAMTITPVVARLMENRGPTNPAVVTKLSYVWF